MKSILGRSFVVVLVIILCFSSLPILNVKAHSLMIITIDIDGSIDPINSSIKHVGNTYTFTQNIRGSIEVIRNNITINGDGYTLDGDGSSTGIDIKHTYDVAVKNLTITNHLIGIKLSALRLVPNFEPPQGESHGTSISNNTLLNNDVGVLGDADHDTVFSRNYLLDNRIGIDSSDSIRPVFSDNHFLNNEESLRFNPSAYVDESNIIDGIPVSTPTPAPTPTLSPTPIPTPEPETFPIILVVSLTTIAVIGLGILVYFKKYRK